MPARRYKSLAKTKHYKHREHRSKRGRKQRNNILDWSDTKAYKRKKNKIKFNDL